MNRQVKIRKPVISILKSQPSSLGTFCYNMVLYERKYQSSFQHRVKELAENIDDQDDYYPFFLLHSTTSRGHPIVPLLLDFKSKTQFRINQTDVDSIISFHCLASQTLESDILLKSGFHAWVPSETSTTDQLRPNSWGSMDNMNGEIHFSVVLNAEQFWRTYSVALTEWRKYTGEIDVAS